MSTPNSPSITPRGSISQPAAMTGIPTPSSASTESSSHTQTSSVPTTVDSTTSSVPIPPQLGLPTALKPIGIINEQNTCFLNSTFQALSATAPLISLLNSTPYGPLIPVPLSRLPRPAITYTRIPALGTNIDEPEIHSLLPVTKTFVACLQKAWKMKDAGGGTYGPGESEAGRNMRLQSLLREMARKYDQYDDYMQQDAHELLRHLLDSMEMEERDIIKKVQPPPPPESDKKKRKKTPLDGISPLPSVTASPVQSTPGSPDGKPPMVLPLPGATTSAVGQDAPGTEDVREIPEDEKLVPWVDVLFGGQLASVVVCEHCKCVSHTYEGFLDISLSLKAAPPPPRKRDRLKAALGIRSKPSSKSQEPTPITSPTNVSESEVSETDDRSETTRDTNDDDDRASQISESGSNLKRNSSLGMFGLKSKGRPSFSFGKRKVSRGASGGEADRTPPSSIPPSPSFSSHKAIGPGPTAAQSAYIQRILAGPPTGQAGFPVDDPLAKLRAANAGEGTAVNNHTPKITGLEESLRAFTSVEVLEGENAFACKKCWKIKAGKYKGDDVVVEEDESLMDEVLNEDGSIQGDDSLSTLEASVNSLQLPSISINSSDSTSDRRVPSGASQRVGRSASAASRSSAATSFRARSPLRRQLGEDDLADENEAEEKANSSDGLSDSSSEEDEEQPSGGHDVFARPKLNRHKSTHFVLRRAFKRYLIAKAPEVLVFHFKRFKQMHKSSLTFATSFYDLKKMDDFVSFPETLDLSPYLAPNRNDYKVTPTATGPHAPYMDWPSPESGPPTTDPVMYRLYAVVVHLGSMINGHYIAYVLVDPDIMFHASTTPSGSGVEHDLTNGVDKLSIEPSAEQSVPPASPGHAADAGKKDKRVWCYCSDTSIRLASIDEVLAAKAYICFYEKN